MAKFKVEYFSSKKEIKVRYYDSDMNFGNYFRVVVNLKRNIFELWHIEKYVANRYLVLTSPKKTLDILGYNLDEFLKYRNCEYFLDSLIDYYKSDDAYREVFFSSDFKRDRGL